MYSSCLNHFQIQDLTVSVCQVQVELAEKKPKATETYQIYSYGNCFVATWSIAC